MNEQMIEHEELIQIFAECTAAIEQDQLTTDECLEKYPQYRAELSGLLQAATQVRALPTAAPVAEFRAEARSRLLAHLPPRAGNNGAAATTATPPTQTVWERIVDRWTWFVGPSLAVGAVLALAFFIFLALWLWPSGKEATLVEQSLPAGKEPTTLAEEMTVPGSAASAESPEEGGALASSAGTNSIFIPIISNPLVLDPETAAVEKTGGFVEVQNGDGTWATVSHLARATTGQRVRTGALSRATITFYDGSQATLGPKTEISLDQVDAQRPADGFRTVVMTQWVGESDHSVDFRNDAGSRYEVVTPNGSGRARGTTFQVLVSPEMQTQVIVSEGRVDVTNLDVTVVVGAGQTTIVPAQEPPGEPHFIFFGKGEVTAMGDTWTIGGQTFTVTANTIIVGNPQIGDVVSVTGYILPDGTLVATHIILIHQAPTNHFMFTGEVENMGDDEWIVAGQAIAVDEETVIEEAIAVGDMVRVQGVILDDGTLLAQRIDRVDDRQPFEFIGVVENITADNWLISGVYIAVDENTEIKDEIVVGDVVKVEGFIQADNTWLATEIKPADNEDKFEFIGPVNAIDPWQVAGISIETDEFTEIDDGIEIGDLVYVEGRVLADGTWLATEIRLLGDEELTFTFIGIVESIDPWIVGGMLIEVDENTVVDDNVVAGSLVLVRGRILADGTWLATLIERLDPDDDPLGCYTITTIVTGVSGNQLIVEGLPPVTITEDIAVEGDISVNTIITITICVSQDGTIIIISIVVIYVSPPPPPPPPDDGNGNGQVTICHIPPGNPSARHTITVGWPAWVNAHRGHGDTLGPCP